MENPAYDGGPDEVGEDTRGDTATSDSGDGDTTATTGDDTATTVGTDSSETGEPDPVCAIEPLTPFRFRIKTPNGTCEPIVGLNLKVWPEDIGDGGITGEACADCGECTGPLYAIDVPELPAFQQNLSALANEAAQLQQPLCLTVGATDHTTLDGGYCLYDSLVVRAAVIESIGVLVGRNNDGTLLPNAVELLGDATPSPVGKVDTCKCDTFWGPGTLDADCCTDLGLDPSTYYLNFHNASVPPGENGPVEFNGQSWQLHVRQAQIFAGCKTGQNNEISWALSRNL